MGAQVKAKTYLHNWWPAGYRGTPKIFRYTGKILPVASLLQSAFSVSISGQHFWSALGSAFATSSSRNQGGYNSKTSLSA